MNAPNYVCKPSQFNKSQLVKTEQFWSAELCVQMLVGCEYHGLTNPANVARESCFCRATDHDQPLACCIRVCPHLWEFWHALRSALGGLKPESKDQKGSCQRVLGVCVCVRVLCAVCLSFRLEFEITCKAFSLAAQQNPQHTEIT